MTDNFDFYGFLENYCKENHIFFIAGPEDYANAVADRNLYAEYDLILTADLTLSPDYGDNFGKVTYNGTIALGRKREDYTTSSLDETFRQKYNRRLLDLVHSLDNIFKSFMCEDDVEITSTMSYALNRFDANIDFVAANVSIIVG